MKVKLLICHDSRLCDIDYYKGDVIEVEDGPDDYYIRRYVNEFYNAVDYIPKLICEVIGGD